MEDNAGVSRFLLLIPMLCSVLSAQGTGNAISSNDRALANAISGLGKRQMQRTPQPERIQPAITKACSVPLQVMRIDERRLFASRSIQAPEVEAMPRATMPAPPCETVSR